MRIPKQYLGAFKCGHRESAKEFIDEDLSQTLLSRILKSNYQDQEAVEALAYVTKFNNEFHKNVIKKDDPDSLHNTDNLRRSLYSRENARNRDVLSHPKSEIISINDSIHDLETMSHDDFLRQMIEHLDGYRQDS